MAKRKRQKRHKREERQQRPEEVGVQDAFSETSDPSATESTAIKQGIRRTTLPRWPIFLAVVLVVSALVRVIILPSIWETLPFYQTTQEGWDQQVYHHWAQELLTGEGAGPDGKLNYTTKAYHHAPLYPYCLSLVYLIAGSSNIAAGIIFNALGGIAAALIVATLARRFFGDFAGLSAGILMGCSGSQINVEATLSHDAILPAILLGGLYLLLVARGLEDRSAGTSPMDGADANDKPEALRNAWKVNLLLLSAGLLFGLATLGRATNLLVAAALTFWIASAIYRHRTGQVVRFVVLFCAPIAVLLALAVARNVIVASDLTLTTLGPKVFYMGNAPDSTGLVGTSWPSEAVTRRVMESGKGRTAWLSELKSEIAKHPTALAAIMWRKTYVFFNSLDVPDNGNYYFVRRYIRSFAWLSFGPLLIYVLGFLGIGMTWRQRRELLPVYLFALSYAASIIVVFVGGRYKLPFLGVLCAFGGAAIWKLSTLVSREQWGRVGAAAIAGLVLLGLFWPREPIAGHHHRLRENSFRNNGDALLKAKRPDEAIAMWQDGAGLFPESGTLRYKLARLYLDRNRPAEALKEVNQFMENDPSLTTAGVVALSEILYNAHMKMGNREEARRAALEFRKRHQGAADRGR